MNILRQVYAVKHKPTGKWLPQAKLTGVKGASHVDLLDAKNTSKGFVRLFYNERAAKAAISAYCLGKFTMTYDDDYSHYEDRGYLKVEPVEWRKKEDFIVVKINLIVED